MLKIVKSLFAIIAVATIAVGSTGAYFVDQENIEDNLFTAGSLDLVLAPGNPMPFSVSDLVPSDTISTGKITLTNATGSIDGDLDIKLANMVQSENGVTAPELAAGDYENGGDLYLSLVIAAYVDNNKDGVFNAGDIQLAYNGQQRAYPGFWGGDFHYSAVSSMLTGWNDIQTMSADQSADLVIMYQLPTTWTYPNYNQNIVMGDSLGFDVLTSLEQVGGSGGVTE